MFVSLVLTLFARNGIAYKGSLGQVAHSWFMAQVDELYQGQVPPHLHDGGNRTRPFTVAILDVPHQATPDAREKAPAQLFALRITSFDADLSGRLTQWQPKASKGSRFGFDVVAATAENALHPWAGATNLKALLAITERAGLGKTLTFEFATPTLFKTGAATPVPFPAPSLLFQSMVTRWDDTIAEASRGEAPQIPARFLEEVGALVEVTHYTLQSQQIIHRYGNAEKPITGCVGVCTYDFYKCDDVTVRIAHMLAHFAFYSGVGAQTASGLGQIRLKS